MSRECGKDLESLEITVGSELEESTADREEQWEHFCIQKETQNLFGVNVGLGKYL